MWQLLLVLALGLGCGDDDAATTAPVKTEAKAKAPKLSMDEKLQKARSLANSSKHDEALALVEELIAQSPDEDSAWLLLEQEALAAGKARELYDRLDAAEAIGGRTGRHHQLRAVLALEAQMPADALAAARQAAEGDAEGAAALI
ncbi:MAG: hypothetical protein QF464_22310, partial [Myxococcota bacterium]|nr:hypothetical protein [Myxococcota bacterium]